MPRAPQIPPAGTIVQVRRRYYGTVIGTVGVMRDGRPEWVDVRPFLTRSFVAMRPVPLLAAPYDVRPVTAGEIMRRAATCGCLEEATAVLNRCAVAPPKPKGSP